MVGYISIRSRLESDAKGGIKMKLDLEEFVELGDGMVKKPKYSEDIEYGKVYIDKNNSLYVIIHNDGNRTIWHASEGMKFIANGGK
jgi:hypothetical protein